MKLFNAQISDLSLIKPYEVCHEKADLKVFVVVMPKEGWAQKYVPSIVPEAPNNL